MFIKLRIWLLNYGKKGHIVFPLTVSLVENKFTAIRAMDGEKPGFPVDVKLDQICDCSACWGMTHMIPVNHCSGRVSGPLVALEEVATTSTLLGN